jgi:hypothetical protein
VFGGGSCPLVRTAVKVHVWARTGTADTSNSSVPMRGAIKTIVAHLVCVIPTEVGESGFGGVLSGWRWTDTGAA